MIKIVSQNRRRKFYAAMHWNFAMIKMPIGTPVQT
jgi:hypothetical protein